MRAVQQKGAIEKKVSSVSTVHTVYIIYSTHFPQLVMDVNAIASICMCSCVRQLGSVRDGCRSLAA